MAPELPHTVLEAVANGNVEVPQVLAGSTILGGYRAAQLLLDGATTWDGCVAPPTDKQIRFLAEKTTRAHTAYGVAFRYHNGAPDKNKLLFGPKRLRHIAMASSRNIVRAASGYAALTLPPLPTYDLPPYYQPTRKEPILPNHRQLVTELYDNPDFRPQAVALTGLWRLAVNTLRSSEGKRFTKLYRQGLLGQPNVQKYALDNLQPLGEIISAGLAAGKALVEEESGYELTDDVLNTFVFGAVFESKSGLAERSRTTTEPNAS